MRSTCYQASEVRREQVDKLREDIPADDSRLADALIEYGMALLKNDRAKDAEPLLRECLSIRETVLDKEHQQIKEARHVLAECLAKLAKFTEAETILIDLANALQENYAVTEDSKAEAIQRVVDLYEAWHAAERNAGYDQKAIAWRARLTGTEKQTEESP